MQRRWPIGGPLCHLCRLDQALDSSARHNRRLDCCPLVPVLDLVTFLAKLGAFLE
jgi:hypothetical protein